MTKPAFKTLDTRTVISGQTVVHKVTAEYKGRKVLFTLENDSYHKQCVALAQVWRPDHLDWSKVFSLVPEELAMKEGAAYLPNKAGASATIFAADLAELQRMTAMIMD